MRRATASHCGGSVAAHNSKKTAPGRPFKPGQSGNPGGRPKTAAFADAVREYLAKIEGGKTNLQTVLDNLKKHKPEVLLYYAFGKPVEHVEHSGGVVLGLADDILARARDYAKQG